MSKAMVSMMGKKLLPTVTRKVNRQKLVLRKQAPHIFFVAGITGTVVSTVMACRATLNLPDVLTEIEGDIDTVKELRNDYHNRITNGDEENPHYPIKELRRDTAYVYAKAGLKLGRLYGPAFGVGVISIGALTGAHLSLSRRNTALMAAYAAVSKAYEDYRERVRNELGEEKELDLYRAITRVTDDQDEDTCVVDADKWSPYARFFDSVSPNWQKDPEFNRMFIQCQQNYANDLLNSRGHLFLNEVYDMLGFERTPAGQVVGWVIGDKGDNYVDFGIYEAMNARFINGLERTPLLDFNVDGVIYDKI